MVRVTDPDASRAFYEAIGMEFRRESPIVRNGELEATLYFYGYPGQDEELELTFGDDDVYKTINQSFVPLKFDVSKGDSDDEERKHRYHAETLPAVVFISTEGKPVGRIDQKMEPDEMLELLRPAIAKLRSGTGMAAENCN